MATTLTRRFSLETLLLYMLPDKKVLPERGRVKTTTKEVRKIRTCTPLA